jgi:hypothetical protein
MDTKSEKQMAKMVEAVQPHCDEQIIAAMTCNHAGSMKSLVFSKLMNGAGAITKSFNLPNPVFIAVGTSTIYAFHYKPRGFKFKIKKEVARWPRNEVKITSEETKMMCYFVLSTGSGESFPLEVPIMMGGKEVVHMFLDALRQS